MRRLFRAFELDRGQPVDQILDQDLVKIGPTPIYEDNSAALKWCENPGKETNGHIELVNRS